MATLLKLTALTRLWWLTRLGTTGLTEAKKLNVRRDTCLKQLEIALTTSSTTTASQYVQVLRSISSVTGQPKPVVLRDVAVWKAGSSAGQVFGSQNWLT